MKKKLAFILTGLLASSALLSACGNSNNAQSPEVSSASESDGSVSGTLSILCWHNQSDYQPLLDAFQNLYPDVEIDFQNVSTSDNQYGQRLNLLASSGELPDVFYIQPPIDTMAESGYLAALNDLDAVEDLSETYRSAYTYNDNVYAYVNNAWVGGVFYNKDLFDEYNLKEPENYDDFLNICKTFYDADIRPLTISGTALPDIMYYLHDTEVLTENPAYDTTINTGEGSFTEGYLDNIKQWKEDFVDTGYLSADIVGYSDEQKYEELASGKAAMTISGPWAIDSLMGYNPDLNLGLFPFVGSNGQEYTVGAVNVGVAISSTAKNKAAAEAFINFLGTDEAILLYQELSGNFVSQDLEYEVNPVMEAVRHNATEGSFALPTIYWTYSATLDPMMQKGLQEIILGTKTPEELVKELDDKQAELAGW